MLEMVPSMMPNRVSTDLLSCHLLARRFVGLQAQGRPEIWPGSLGVEVFYRVAKSSGVVEEWKDVSG